MHELGIVVHITKTLKGIAEENQLKEIASVSLELGEVSGIIPEILTDCWNYYRKKFPLIEEAELKFDTLPAVTYCEDCGNLSYCTIWKGMPALWKRSYLSDCRK